MIRILLLVAALLALPILTVASEDSRLFLTWHAPYGMPRASTALTVACGDTTAEDTLYLVCDPGNDSPSFLGFDATLFFHAQVGDTLGPYWRSNPDPGDPRILRVLWEPDSTVRFPVPWRSPGLHFLRYDFTRGSGRLRMASGARDSGYALKYGTKYLLARVAIHHPGLEFPDCAQPICVEWAMTTLSLWFTFDVSINRGDRFASWNSIGSRACEEFRREAAKPPLPWKPKGAGRGP